MRILTELSAAEFRDNSPHSEALYFDANGRALRFSLRPGQAIKEHDAPNSPFYVVILQGRGVFTGGDGVEREVGPDTLLIFDPAERHSVRALDEDLVFVGFLHGVPSTPADKRGGSMVRDER